MACSTPSRRPQRSSSVAGDGLERLGVVDVELEHVGLGGQALGHPLGDPHPAAEAGEDDLGALFLGAARDGEGDRLVGQHAGDEQLSSFEEHACTTTASAAVARHGFDACPANVEPFG